MAKKIYVKFQVLFDQLHSQHLAYMYLCYEPHVQLNSFFPPRSSCNRKQCRYGNKAGIGVHIYIAYLAIVEVWCDTEVGVRSRQHVEYQVVSPSIPAGKRERGRGEHTMPASL